MRLLAFDTLGPALSAAAVTGLGGGVAAFRALPPAGAGQAERLLPLLDEVLAAAGWGWRDLDALAVTVGPGGFTAVRTGVATARALALALDRPVLGIGTLEATAEAVAAADGPGPILVLKDLRRGDFAAQAFGGDDLTPEGPARLLDRPAALAAAAGARRLAGDAAAAITRNLPPSGTPPVVEAHPDARYVAAAALRRVTTRGEEPVAGTSLRPFYLRAPDARADAGRPLVATQAAAAPQ